MRQQTLQRVASPTAILVSVPEPVATALTDILAEGGLRVLRVGHVAAACERIPVTMPQLVVHPTSLRAEDAESIADRCVAVGADVIAFDLAGNMDALKAQLKDASKTAIVRSLRRSTAG